MPMKQSSPKRRLQPGWGAPSSQVDRKQPRHPSRTRIFPMQLKAMTTCIKTPQWYSQSQTKTISRSRSLAPIFRGTVARPFSRQPLSVRADIGSDYQTGLVLATMALSAGSALFVGLKVCITICLHLQDVVITTPTLLRI